MVPGLERIPLSKTAARYTQKEMDGALEHIKSLTTVQKKCKQIGYKKLSDSSPATNAKEETSDEQLHRLALFHLHQLASQASYKKQQSHNAQSYAKDIIKKHHWWDFEQMCFSLASRHS